MASDKERAALGSILASAGLTAAKAAVGFASGSLAILSEAAHSLIDLIATIMTYVAVRIADKPADDRAPLWPRQGGKHFRSRRNGAPVRAF